MLINPYFDGDFSKLKALFPASSLTVGLGVTALPRAALGYFLPNYQIVSLLETSDLAGLRKLFPVISLEKTLNTCPPEKFSTSSLLSCPQVVKYLAGLSQKTGKKINLAVYKASTQIDDIVKKQGLNLLSTPGIIRRDFEHKKYFRTDGQKAGLNLIPGESMKVADLTEKKYQKLMLSYGSRLVFQLTGYSIGGGRGTFFINEKKDFVKFKDFVNTTGQRIVKYTGVNVTKFIDGVPASVVACATRYGTLVSILQTQIMDQPELSPFSFRNGNWNGHDWFINFPLSRQLKAEAQAKKWGDFIFKKGYRGIFGLDVVVEAQTGKIWPVECNSRYTGAFPVYTMMQLNQGEVPLDLFHFLEWFGIDYQIDLDQVQKLYRQPKKGSHFILANLEKKFVIVAGQVKGGVYNFSQEKDKIKIQWQRPGFSLLDLKNDHELVLADRAPLRYSVLKPAERIGRLIFKRPVIDHKGRLLPKIKEIINNIYNLFELTPIQKPKGF